ncbi:MAG: hypothetical protein ACW97A_07840 [Candidatus Thorarchaeota archaeon]|jgi:hypothetical protein
MPSTEDDIARREFKHGKMAYGFRWNRTNHERIGNNEGDSASLWAHLGGVLSGKMPEEPFRDPFYSRASALRLSKMSPAKRVSLRKRLIKTGALKSAVDDDIVHRIRSYHRSRKDVSYRADHGILTDFLSDDPCTIAIEVPVWSDRYKLSGHIDLIRVLDDIVQVCDYKPGSLDTTKNRFLQALPQVSAYGEMMTHHLASTLRSALNSPLLPKVRCCIFDTHSSWHFGAELFVTLETSGKITGL